mmetsp:Transcript_9353/g.7128  ORF Transcript_9353/g.7128 Transcript_9353/m.7128 type:complete len:93 (+) Transcript_9353:290-568(+)
MMIRDENVMVTMLAYELLKNMIENMMMTDPWKMDDQTQMQNVLKLRFLPFYSVLYRGGNLSTESTLESSSKTSEKTGRDVYTVAYPSIRNPL